jgi:hypothetical protein
MVDGGFTLPVSESETCTVKLLALAASDLSRTIMHASLCTITKSQKSN